MQHHGLGPLVAGAQEELGFLLAGRSGRLRLLRLLFTRQLQDLIDLRGQQLGLPGRRAPSGREGEDHRRKKNYRICQLWFMFAGTYVIVCSRMLLLVGGFP